MKRKIIFLLFTYCFSQNSVLELVLEKTSEVNNLEENKKEIKNKKELLSALCLINDFCCNIEYRFSQIYDTKGVVFKKELKNLKNLYKENVFYENKPVFLIEDESVTENDFKFLIGMLLVLRQIVEKNQTNQHAKMKQRILQSISNIIELIDSTYIKKDYLKIEGVEEKAQLKCVDKLIWNQTKEVLLKINKE